jgi:hypothetical protein
MRRLPFSLTRGCVMLDETPGVVLEDLRIMRVKLNDIAADCVELEQRPKRRA